MSIAATANRLFDQLVNDWCSVPERVRIAAEYCSARGATISVDRQMQPTVIAKFEDGSTGLFGNGAVMPMGGIAMLGDDRMVVVVRVTAASDADAVGLRLAGFAPVGDAWVWKSA